MLEKLNIKDKFQNFSDLWSPKIIASLNGQYVKLAKVKGDFIWHVHENEDELFMVVSGTLFIQLEDQTVELNPGELFVVPKGIRHKPFTKKGVAEVLLFEPQEINHTGNIIHERTVTQENWI